MKVKEMVRDNKVKWAIACVIIGLVFAVGITLVSCSGIASVGGIGANQAVADAADGVVENVDLPEAETESIGQEADDETGTEKAESISGDEATAQGKAAPSQGSAEDAQHQRSTGEPKGNSAVPSQSASQKKWRTQSAYGSLTGKPGLKAFPFIARWRSPSATSAEPTLPATPPPMRKST